MPARIPDFLAHLPTHSGLPVPFVTGRNAAGKFDFRLTDPRNHAAAQRFQLCGICGKHIAGPPYVFLLGRASRDARLVFEPAMHLVCAHAAMTLCPFLSREHWERADPRRGDDFKPAYARDEIPTKPPRMGLGFAPYYRAVRNPDNGMYYAELPAEEFPIQWWAYAAGVLAPVREDTP